MKITKDKDNLIITIPLRQEINNCYKVQDNLPLTDNLVGIIAGDEFTISHLNDLNYKDSQQEGSPILYFEDEEELREACKIGEIMIWEYDICIKCGKAIRGASSWDNGHICYSCNLKNEKI
ncbi:MAG: hypothetical protein GWP19_01785 [Planctomycetia bacterium]|nr:hypothetical protein [Planctomycetia bacterium]